MLLASIFLGLILLLTNVAAGWFSFFGNDDDDCQCYVDHTKEYVNLCYKNKDTGVIGQRFPCEFYDKLRYLGLADYLAGEVEPFFPVTEEELYKEMVFVTAMSQSHVEKGLRLIASIRKVFKKARILVYDLGMDKESSWKINKLCNVEVIEFYFPRYPKVVRNLGEYRWKPIIIAETLAVEEIRYFWYVDTSVIIKHRGMMRATKLFTCNKTGARDYARDLDLKKRFSDQLFYYNKKECSKSSMLTYSFSGHGTWAASGDEMYKYFPPDFDKLKHPHAKMMEAGLISIIDSEKTRDILKWWVLCSFQTDCMRTRFIRPTCYFDHNNPYTVHAGCHRWDQSVLNVLMSMEYNYRAKNYAAEFTDFFEIDREYPEHPINYTAFDCSN